MELRKYKWSRVYEAAEEDLVRLLQMRHIAAERWVAEPDKVFSMRMHAKDKQLWCAEGSIVFSVNSMRISLQAGDALDIPAYTTHEAVAGLNGCVCYEYPERGQNLAISSDV